MNHIFIHLIYNSALLVPIVIFYTSFSFESLIKSRLNEVWVGCVISIVGLFVMENPFLYAPGVILDSRSILLSISAMFFPYISTLIAMVVMGSYRIFLGGPGMIAGLAILITSTSIGFLFKKIRFPYVFKGKQIRGIEFLIVGFITHIVVFLDIFLLPEESLVLVLPNSTIPIVVVYPIVEYLLIMLILRSLKQRNVLKQLEESEHQFKIMFEQAPIGITLTDSKTGVIIDSNLKFQKIVGLTEDEIQKVDWMRITHPDDITKDKELMSQLVKGEISSFSMDKRFIHKNGNLKWTNISVSSLFSEKTVHPHHLCMVVDIHNRKETEEKIFYAYVHDHLTGLPNHTDFMSTLHRLKKQHKFPFAIAIADVNGFKMINDAFNREAGDALLLQIANILKIEKGLDDYVARIGGDEFALIMNGGNEESTSLLIQRIQQRIQGLPQHKVVVSLSFGVVVAQDDAVGIDELLKKAEDDLNQNKLHESPSTRSKALYTIIHTLHEKNPREELHSRRVSVLGARLSQAIGMNFKEIAQMKTVGLLHDIGKINIDQSILNKEGPLNESEWKEMKKHPQKGYRILLSVTEFGELSGYVLSHHERIDGKGYPQGLKGEEIPLQSRIIAIVDAFDAMTAWRPYKEMMSEEEAAKELIRCSGTQFDTALATTFVKQVLQLDI